MDKTLYKLLCIVGIGCSALIANDANYVKETVNMTRDKQRVSVTTNFYGGTGKLIQTQNKLNAFPGKAIVSSTYRSSFGLDSIVPLPVVTTIDDTKPFIPLYGIDDGTGLVDYTSLTIRDMANTYYDGSNYDAGSFGTKPNAENFAFVETKIENWGSLTSSAGKTYSFHGDGDQDERINKSWHFALNFLLHKPEYFDSEGFLTTSFLSRESVEDLLIEENSICNRSEMADSIMDIYDHEEEFYPEIPDGGSYIVVSKLDGLIKKFTILEDSKMHVTTIAHGIGATVWVKSSKSYYQLVPGEDGNDKVWGDFEPTYSLTVNRDIEGRFTQTYTNKLGQVEKSWQLKDVEPLISKQEYDILGNVSKTTPPKLNDAELTEYDHTYFAYDMQGQLVISTYPDRGRQSFIYDSLGNVLVSFDELQLQKAENSLNSTICLNFYEYDEKSRQTALYTYEGPLNGKFPTKDSDWNGELIPIIKESGTLRKITIYDTLTIDVLSRFKNHEHYSSLESTIIPAIKASKGATIATIALNEKGRDVLQFSNYNERGEVADTYVLIPGLPIQKQSFSYDFSGNITNEKYYNGIELGVWEFVSGRVYNYDGDSKLISIDYDNDNNVATFNPPLVSYRYVEDGTLIEKTFYKAGTGEILDKVQFQYDINGRLLRKQTANEHDYNGENRRAFEFALHYDKYPGGNFLSESDYKSKYDGSISGIEFRGLNPASGGDFDISLSYAYDNLNMLKSVSEGNTTSPEGKNFAESFTYDNWGRLKRKTENGLDLPQYEYSEFGRLRYIEGSQNRDKSGSADNYLYDPNGNMIFDRSKKMVVEYDWRNMPIAYKFFTYVPRSFGAVAISWENIHLLEGYETIVSGQPVISKILSVVEMVYDADGKRVQKITRMVEGQ